MPAKKPTVREQLAALNSRPAIVTIRDEKTGALLEEFTMVNRPAALALPVAPGTIKGISVDMMDIVRKLEKKA